MFYPAANTIRLVGSTINCYITNAATITPYHSVSLYAMMGSGGQRQKLFPCMCRDVVRTKREVGLPRASSNSW